MFQVYQGHQLGFFYSRIIVKMERRFGKRNDGGRKLSSLTHGVEFMICVPFGPEEHPGLFIYLFIVNPTTITLSILFFFFFLMCNIPLHTRMEKWKMIIVMTKGMEREMIVRMVIPLNPRQEIIMDILLDNYSAVKKLSLFNLNVFSIIQWWFISLIFKLYI